jgi:hypothetical protein
MFDRRGNGDTRDRHLIHKHSKFSELNRFKHAFGFIFILHKCLARSPRNKHEVRTNRPKHCLVVMFFLQFELGILFKVGVLSLFEKRRELATHFLLELLDGYTRLSVFQVVLKMHEVIEFRPTFIKLCHLEEVLTQYSRFNTFKSLDGKLQSI